MTIQLLQVIWVLLLPVICWVILKIIGKQLERIPLVKKHKAFPAIVLKKLFFPLSTLFVLYYVYFNDSIISFFTAHGVGAFEQIATILIFGCWAFLLSRVLNLFVILLNKKFDINHHDNLRQRRIRTRIQCIQKIAIIVIWIITVALALQSFENFEEYGKSILASAGLVSVILGFAAQKSLGNLIAGFQIAFTQPLRIDDAVVVESEWGWIEEITLTYIVVRVWDQRRLILPITYFVDKPFQNWTRNSAEIIGTVFIYVNYSINIEKLRQEFNLILEQSPLWNKKSSVLQVVELKERCVELRALMSASNSSNAWDLRCYVREKLVDYLQTLQENPMPTYFVSLEKSEESV